MKSNRRFLPFVATSLVLLTGAARAADVLVTQAEMDARDRWTQGTMLSMDKPVISFVYGGTPSAEILPGWKRSPATTVDRGDGTTEHRLSWTDPASGLEVRIVGVEYKDYPEVEWTTYLKNTGTRPTPMIDQLRGIDSGFTALSALDSVLRTTRGDFFSASSYEPLSFELDQEARTFQPTGGRPTNGAWPYFNVDGGKEGEIVAVGWPGQWQTEFSRDKNVVAVKAGQETVHLVLQPGEEIRTPLIAVLFWRGESWIPAQNLWRHWYLAHVIPKPNGKLPSTAIVLPELHTAAATDLTFLDSYLAHGLTADYLWVDAGWYEMDKGWFAATGIGTWKPDPIRYPHGIREVSDYAHSKGLQFVLWFEPERVYRGSYLWNNHPDWLLPWKPNQPPSNKPNDAVNLRLLNLGNPDARHWLTDYISRFITDQHVDLYRQDFNVDPLVAWSFHDAPDRQGMTENLYVQGYLAYWDDLRQQHPGMLIDSCASGGRRNDLETMRRSVPLLRSDYQAPNLPTNKYKMSTDVFDGNQGHTYGMSFWIPYYGQGEYAEDVYSSRSHLCPFVAVGTHMENPDWNAVARQIADHRPLADLFFGDYYPLTPYTKSEEAWIAWEFTRPAHADGMIQAFRRENSPDVNLTVKLQGLKADANYEITNLDVAQKIRASGKSLMEDGLKLDAESPRTALIITFKQVP
jgi:alpha-galactosidase